MSGEGTRAGPPPLPYAGDSLASSLGWLLLDMALVTAMQAMVKAQGSVYPAIQLVFLRSLVGLAVVMPLVVRHRRELTDVKRIRTHLIRVGCNALALTMNFFAFATLPLALVTAIGFTRPMVLLGMAALMLGERVGVTRFAMTGLGFLGILLMVRPDTVAWDLGLAAAFGSVVFGTLSIIQTRRLHDESTTILMLFYTAGLTAVTAGPALVLWQPIPLREAPAIAAVGVLAQLGQYCWLRAYRAQEARLLAPFGYFSIVFTTVTGYLVFGEVPSLWIGLGATVVILATNLTGPVERWMERRRTR